MAKIVYNKKTIKTINYIKKAQNKNRKNIKLCNSNVSLCCVTEKFDKGKKKSPGRVTCGRGITL